MAAMCEQCITGCPNCWDRVTCERCDGRGDIFFVVDPESGERYECTYEEWLKTVKEFRDEEECPDCDGSGWCYD